MRLSGLAYALSVCDAFDVFCRKFHSETASQNASLRSKHSAPPKSAIPYPCKARDAKTAEKHFLCRFVLLSKMERIGERVLQIDRLSRRYGKVCFAAIPQQTAPIAFRLWQKCNSLLCSTQKYVIINAQNTGGAIWHSKK